MPPCPKCQKEFKPMILKFHEPTCEGKILQCTTCGAAYKATDGHTCMFVPKPKVYDGNAPIVELLKRNSGSIKPMHRSVPEYIDVFKKLQGTLDSSFNSLSCSEDTVRRLCTALCYTEKEGLLSSSLANRWKIKQFMALSEGFQIQVINNIWEECTSSKSYDCTSADMVETEADVAASDSQLPSSVHPNPGSGLPFVKGPTKRPWKTLGIGFRVDGQKDSGGTINSIDRIKKEGITSQVLNPGFMLNIRGMVVTQTALALNTSAPRIYVRAQDLFNETAVCISRSFFGATAFPERETAAEAALWAVDTTGLSGFDTEKHQLEIGKPWRPGEKCFQKIPVNQVLGYVVIKRLGGDLGSGGTRSSARANGGWEFQVPKGAKWTWVTQPTGAKLAYVEAELAAWANGVEYNVPGSYDFK
jgi:hypothetical protein